MSEILFISTASRLLGMHPQTLRKYERLGLVRPERTVGSMRLYSPQQIERLRFIKHLVDERRINLAGVRHLLAVADAVRRLQPLADGDALSRRGGQSSLAAGAAPPERAGRTAANWKRLSMTSDRVRQP